MKSTSEVEIVALLVMRAMTGLTTQISKELDGCFECTGLKYLQGDINVNCPNRVI